jgi:hypothetical protein
MKGTTSSLKELASTLFELDLREATRFSCHSRQRLTITVRPNFGGLDARVWDISTKGIALVSDQPIQPGWQLAILWHFGPPERWHTLHAQVVRVAPRPDGSWLAGCQFDARLQLADVEAFLSHVPGPEHQAVHDE